jgi:precorrin-6B methylase 2
LRLWVSFAATSSLILDVGANTGVNALAAKSTNPQADVYAFEPVAPIFAKLSENAAFEWGGRVGESPPYPAR